MRAHARRAHPALRRVRLVAYAAELEARAVREGEGSGDLDPFPISSILISLDHAIQKEFPGTASRTCFAWSAGPTHDAAAGLAPVPPFRGAWFG